MARESKSDVWMPLYVGDYLRDTTHLSTEAHGAYCLLLMSCWVQGGRLPGDDASLAAICRVPPARFRRILGPVLRPFFCDDGEGGLTHKRVAAELERAGGVTAKRSKSGKRGAAERWGSESSAATRSQRLAEARKLGTHTAAEWAALVEICGNVCLRCHTAVERLVKDHIVPIYRPGSTDAIDNLQPLCRACNLGKGPEAVDYRPADWRERLAKRLAKPLANGCQMTGQSQSPDRDATSVSIGEEARARVPDEIRRAAGKLVDEAWLRSHLDPCGWQEVPFRALIAVTETAALRLEQRLRPMLKERGVAVLHPPRVGAA